MYICYSKSYKVIDLKIGLRKYVFSSLTTFTIKNEYNITLINLKDTQISVPTYVIRVTQINNLILYY